MKNSVNMDGRILSTLALACCGLASTAGGVFAYALLGLTEYFGIAQSLRFTSQF